MSANLPEQWLDRDSEDLTVARLVLKEGYASHACFLAQQCIEKSLKAYLLARTKHYPRAHKLIDLVSECGALQDTFVQFRGNCIVVDQYYIPTRYPDGIPGGLASGLPSMAEAREALTSAEKILKFVVIQLQ